MKEKKKLSNLKQDIMCAKTIENCWRHGNVNSNMYEVVDMIHKCSQKLET